MLGFLLCFVLIFSSSSERNVKDVGSLLSLNKPRCEEVMSASFQRDQFQSHPHE